jgi:hypothetical protein
MAPDAARRRIATVVIRALDPPAGPKPVRRGEGPRIHLQKRLLRRRWMAGSPGHDASCNEGIVILAQRLRRYRGRCALLRASKDGRLHS